MFLYPKQGPRRQAGEIRTILGQVSCKASQPSESWAARGLFQASEVQVPGEPGRPWCTPFLGLLYLVQR